MFRIGPNPDPIDADVLKRAAAIEPSTIGHLLDCGFAHGIRPVTSATKFVGTAFTVRLAAMDATAIHYAMDQTRPGDVVVVDMGGGVDRACIGAILAYVARVRGVAGIVIDGMATDIADIEEAGVPTFARGLSPMTTRALGIEGDLNVPISVGGAVVVPGDLVLADANGVLFINPNDFIRLEPQAIAAQEWEIPFRAQMDQGASLSEASGAAAHIRKSGVLIAETTA